MGPLNLGDDQHPSIRPNGRGGGLVRMDGETAVAAWQHGLLMPLTPNWKAAMKSASNIGLACTNRSDNGLVLLT